MTQRPQKSVSILRSLARGATVLLILCLFAIFILWRIDSPRVERFRMALSDIVMPNVERMSRPVTLAADLIRNYQSYANLIRQNDDLRRELQRMRAWREAAIQLEQQNAQLLELNQVRLNASLTYVTAQVIADSGSPFRQSVLINVGARDGILNGWATIDGIGLVGRIVGVGEKTSRVLLLTDTNSRMSVTIQPSGQKALLSGDNSSYPLLDFIEDPYSVRPGDRIVTSGDGKLFPPDFLVGQVVMDNKGRLRASLSADYRRLKFLRILRSNAPEKIENDRDIIGPIYQPDINSNTPPTSSTLASPSKKDG